MFDGFYDLCKGMICTWLSGNLIFKVDENDVLSRRCSLCNIVNFPIRTNVRRLIAPPSNLEGYFSGSKIFFQFEISREFLPKNFKKTCPPLPIFLQNIHLKLRLLFKLLQWHPDSFKSHFRCYSFLGAIWCTPIIWNFRITSSFRWSISPQKKFNELRKLEFFDLILQRAKMLKMREIFYSKKYEFSSPHLMLPLSTKAITHSSERSLGKYIFRQNEDIPMYFAMYLSTLLEKNWRVWRSPFFSSAPHYTPSMKFWRLRKNEWKFSQSILEEFRSWKRLEAFYLILLPPDWKKWWNLERGPKPSEKFNFIGKLWKKFIFWVITFQLRSSLVSYLSHVP